MHIVLNDTEQVMIKGGSFATHSNIRIVRFPGTMISICKDNGNCGFRIVIRS